MADPADPRLRDFTRLTDVALRRVREPAEGLFIAEGELVVARAFAAGYPPRALLCEERFAHRMAELAGAATGLPAGPVYAAPAEVLRLVTGFHVHRGVLGSFARRPLPSPAQLLAAGRRLLAVEDSNNPTNLGAIARSAAGLGIDGLLLSPGCADPLYRRCVRVSMGAVLSLPYGRCSDWPGELIAPGFALLALTPDPDAEPLSQVVAGLPAEQRVILLLGAEGPGLSEPARRAAERSVRIPMRPGVDSLNVAAAAAIACYELTRPAGPPAVANATPPLATRYVAPCASGDRR